MATTVSTLVQQTRRFMRDWPDLDALGTSLTSFGTSVTVADTSLYQSRWPIEVESETMMIRAVASGSNLTVLRGAFGSTAAAHSSGAEILIRPSFYATEVIDALNTGLDDCYPTLYKEVVNSTSLSVTSATVYEYAVPFMTGSTTAYIDFLSSVELKSPGDYAWRHTDRWDIRRGTAPVIRFHEVPAVGSTIRVRGFGAFSSFATVADTVDAQFPKNAESLLPLAAAAHLTASGEAGRIRMTAGAVDSREQANRAGSSMSLSNALYSRFLRQLENAAMSPLSPHVVSVF